MTTPAELAKKFDKLPSRDQRVLEKVIDRMVEWNLTFPRAIANATVQWNRLGGHRAGGGDEEFDQFEQSLDWWIDAGTRYG